VQADSGVDSSKATTVQPLILQVGVDASATRLVFGFQGGIGHKPMAAM
jgi:hypothetical protein